MAGEGKKFEKDFKVSADLDNADVCVTRLFDTMGGYAGVKNICDFILYNYPHIYYFELKATQEDSLAFVNITRTQWDGLTKVSKIDGTISGILVNFYTYEEVYFIPIEYLNMIKSNGATNIHINEARKFTRLKGTKKRVTFTYEVRRMLKDLQSRTVRIWGN